MLHTCLLHKEPIVGELSQMGSIFSQSIVIGCGKESCLADGKRRLSLGEFTEKKRGLQQLFPQRLVVWYVFGILE